MSLRPRFHIDQSHYALVVRRPVAILMVTIAVAVFGAVSYQRLALTLMPDMSYPTLTVRTAYPGTAPEEVENVISRPLEQQLGIIPKLVSISSISKAGLSDVILEFQWKTDMDIVAQEVREKVDRVRLPEGAERPLLLHYDPSLDPILRLGLAGKQSLYELRHMAEQEVKRRLESISGVAAIQIKGGLEEEFLVALDEAKLANLKLDISQIAQRLQAGNVNMPGGNLREGQVEYVIRTLNEFKTLEEIGGLIISRTNSAVDIRLRDVATIKRYHRDREVITRVNGQESVEIEVYKEADANVLSVAAAVKEAIFGTPVQQAYVEQMNRGAGKPATGKAAPAARSSFWSRFSMSSASSGKATPEKRSDAKKTEPKKTEATKTKTPNEARDAARAAAMAEVERARVAAQEQVTRRLMTNFIAQQLPPGSSIQLLSDQSIFIRNSIDEVKDNAIFGGLIAIAVLYLFLRNVTQTVIVSLCIPISILATFAPMHMAGVSLNIISLGGLALGVGNLVDNAIVVLESIFRCREEGDDPVTSVVRGTSEVAMPVVASTLTTVAVFLPIVFVEGVAGQMFGDMALAVVFSQVASLIAALYLIPMLASNAAGLAAGGTPGLSVGAAPGAAVPAAQGSTFLQFPLANGRTRWQQARELPGFVVRRTLLAIAVMLAAVVKAVIVLVFVVWVFVTRVLWGAREAALWLPRLLLLIGVVRGAWEQFRSSGPGRVLYVCATRPTAREMDTVLGGWAEADAIGGLRGASVWPRALAFGSVAQFNVGLRRTIDWLLARPWRWIGLLVLPAVAVIVLLVQRVGVIVPPSSPPLPPGFPPPPGYVPPPAVFLTPPDDLSFGWLANQLEAWRKAIWYWLVVQPWWLLVLLFVPATVPLALAVARAILETILRATGTVVQTVLLLLAHGSIALARAAALVLAPLASGGLSGFGTAITWLQDRYPVLLKATLRYRHPVMGSATVALIVSLVFVVPRLGSDLIPQVQQGEFMLDLTLPIGTPLERTAVIAERIDRVVRTEPEVARTAITVGAEEGASSSIEAGEHTARLSVRLKQGLPPEAEANLVDRIRHAFRDLPEAKLEVSYPSLFSFRSPIEVEIRGHDLDMLKRLSREAERRLADSVPGLVDVRSTLQAGHPEIQIVYNRDRLIEYGLNLRTVAELVRNKVQGRAATEFRRADQLIDIVVRLREEDRFGIAELRNLVVNPNGAVPLPLSSVATLSVHEGPSEIRRVDQQRTAVITANIRDADLSTVSREIMNTMNGMDFPAGFSFNVAGQNKEMQTSLNSLLLAFALAMFLVYIVMASQFESLVQPFLIMMTVPLASIGVVWVLWLADIPVTVMVFLGLIILVGIVVNNAIVLIDYINTLRGRGMAKTEAIIEAGRARLRPILMTALTTIVGLVPMALGMGEGAEIRAPMAITVIVGLSTATVLTLVVIPTLYFQFTSDKYVLNPEANPAGPAEPEPQPIGK